jgi:hypothetical protein
MTAAAAAGATAAEAGGVTAAVPDAGADVVAAVVGGVTAGGDGDGVVAATDGGGADDAGEADADAGGVATGVSTGGDETLAGVVGRGAVGTSTLARDGVVTPAASRAGSCESGRGRRGGSGAVARTVGGGSDLTSASDRAGGSDLAGGAGCTAIGGGVSAIAAVCCEGFTVGSGTLGDGEGGAEVTGGRIGAVGIDSGAFDCCMTTTANMAAIPATATSETG